MSPARFSSRAPRCIPPRGRIVNVASVLGLSGGLYPDVACQASKGAVINLTRAVAVEWAPLGSSVNAVAPGWIDTPFIANALANPEVKDGIERATPLGRFGGADDAASAILFLATRASSFVTRHALGGRRRLSQPVSVRGLHRAILRRLGDGGRQMLRKRIERGLGIDAEMLGELLDLL